MVPLEEMKLFLIIWTALCYEASSSTIQRLNFTDDLEDATEALIEIESKRETFENDAEKNITEENAATSFYNEHLMTEQPWESTTMEFHTTSFGVKNSSYSRKLEDSYKESRVTSLPVSYENEEWLGKALGPNGHENDSELFKRRANFGREFYKMKIESVKKADKTLEFLYDIPFGGTELKENSLFCSQISENVIALNNISSSLKIEEIIRIAGGWPCQVISENVIAYVRGKKSLLISRIYDHKEEEIQEIFLPGSVMKIESWEQKRGAFLLTKHLKDIEGYKSNQAEFNLYLWQSGKYKFIQSFASNSFGDLHHFEINDSSFLAIPNNFNGTELYVYSSKRMMFIPFQTLDVPASTSVLYFGIKSEKLDFLVVTSYCSHDLCKSESDSVIFKYNERNFEVFQTLHSSGAIQSMILKHKNEVFLSILSPHTGLGFYHYDGELFINKHPKLDYELVEEGISLMLNYELNSEVFIAIHSIKRTDSKWMTFKVYFEEIEVNRNEKQISEWCLRALSSMTSKFEKVKEKVELALLKTNPLEIEDLKVENLEVYNELRVPVFSKDIQREFDDKVEKLEYKLNNLKKLSNEVEDAISKAIDVNETRDWPDNLRLSSVVILGAKTKKLYTQFVNGQKVPLARELIPVGASLPLDLNTKTFRDVYFQENLSVDTLNGYPLSSYVTLKGNHHLHRNIIFDTLSTSSIKIGGVIDDVAVDNSTLLLKSGAQVYKGSLKCKGIKASGVEAQYVNGENIYHLMKETYITNTSLSITGDVNIYGDVKYFGDLSVGTLLGMEPKYFKDDLLLLHSLQPQTLSGHFDILNMKTEEIHVRESLNKMSFSDSVYVDFPSNTYHVYRAKFDNVQANFLAVDKNFNDIQVIDGRLDVVSLNEDQIITGRKTLHEMHLENFLYKTSPEKELVEPYINVPAREKLKVENFNHRTYLKISENLSAENGYLNILRDIRYELMRILETKPTKLYRSRMKYDEKEYALLNRSLSEITSIIQEIVNILEENQLFAIKNILNQLHRTDKTVLNQLQTYKVFPVYFAKKAENMYTLAKILLFKVEKMISMKKEMLFSLYESKNKFEKIIKEKAKKYHIQNVVSKGSFVKGLIGGFDLHKLPSLQFRYEDALNATDIVRKVLDADKVVFMKGLYSPNINKININLLLDQVVPLSSRETDLDLVFEDAVSVQGDFRTSYINNVVVSSLAKINSENVFEKDVEFQDMLCNDNVVVKGLANNFNIESVAPKIARTDMAQEFAVPIIIDSVSVQRVNFSKADLNDVPLEEYVLHDSQSVVTGKKQFGKVSVLSSLVLIQDLHTEELGMMDLTQSVDSRIAFRNLIWKDDLKLSSLTVKGSAHVLRSIKNSKMDFSLNLTKIYEKSFLTNRNETVRGSLVFEGDVFVKNLKFNKTFDGLAADTYSAGLMIQGEPQELTGRNYFKTLKVKNLITKNKMIQGIDVNHLITNSVKINQNYEFPASIYLGHVSSRKPVNVSGFIQGVNLTRDAVLYSESPIVITGGKTFYSPVTIEGEINVKGLVNGMDVDETCGSILGEVEIKGSVHFGKGLYSDKLYYGDKSIPGNNSSYWLIDKSTKIISEMKFEDVEAEGVYIEDRMNGEDVDSIVNGPIPSNCNKEPNLGTLNIDSIYAHQLLGNSSEVNNINGESSKILKDVILNSTTQYFDNELLTQDLKVKDLEMSSEINGLKMSDFCLKESVCKIDAEKRFENLSYVRGDWIIGDESRINDLKLKHFEMTQDDFSSTVVIDGSLHAPAVRITGLLNEVRFDGETLLTLNTDQTMSGSLHIVNSNQLAFKAKNVKILSQNFKGINISSVVAAEQLIQNAAIKDDSRMKSLLNHYRELFQNILHIYTVTKDYQATFLGWNQIGTFDGYSDIFPLQPSDVPSLLVGLASPGGVQLKIYSQFTGTYKNSNFLKINCTNDAKAFVQNKQFYLGISTTCSNPRLNVNKYLQGYVNLGGKEKFYSYIFKGLSLQVIDTKEEARLLAFSVFGRTCFLFVTDDEQSILCEDNASYLRQQIMRFGKIVRVLHINTFPSNESLLVVASYESLDQIFKTSILKLNKRTGHFDVAQEISSENLIWIAAVSYYDSILLATIHKPFLGSHLGRVLIYRLKTEIEERRKNVSDWGFIHEESISLADPLQAAFLNSPSGELSLVVLNKGEYIMRYVKKGYSKFHAEGAMHVPGAKSLKTWMSGWGNIYHLAVSTENRKDKLLKSSVKIFSPLYSGLLPDY